MKARKVFFCLLMSGCLTLCAVVSPIGEKKAVHAASLVNLQRATLARSGPYACIDLLAKGTASVKKVKVTYTLQRYVSGKWSSYFTWNDSASSQSYSISRKYMLVDKGTYRIKLAATYSNSSTSSTTTTYSSSITY